MARRSIVVTLIPFTLVAVGTCGGCGQKQDAAVPAAPQANNTRYPPEYVQQRTARERPMPLNTETGK
jgi:hypothetical protein